MGGGPAWRIKGPTLSGFPRIPSDPGNSSDVLRKTSSQRRVHGERLFSIAVVGPANETEEAEALSEAE
jgi:hypothetical protein